MSATINAVQEFRWADFIVRKYGPERDYAAQLMLAERARLVETFLAEFGPRREGLEIEVPVKQMRRGHPFLRELARCEVYFGMANLSAILSVRGTLETTRHAQEASLEAILGSGHS
ncbi:MAG: hypothetical protein AB7L71_19470 [Vicinamibacterales bacterium]